MDKQLKIFALEYVKLHDNLSKEQKLVIGEFVMESSDDLVKFMLLTGEIKDELTEEEIKETEAHYQQHMGWLRGHDAGKEVGFERGVVGSVQVAVVVAAVAVLAYQAYKRFLSKAARSCKGKSGLDKTNCMVKYKKQAQAAKVKTLQSGMSKCAKTKDPAKCKTQLQGKISKEKAKMGAL